MHVSDLEAKIEKSEKKLERTRDTLHRRSILARVNTLRTTLNYWKGFLERGHVPPAVFGGKKNLLLLQEGKLSKEEWRELRSNAFYSVGQANQKGREGQHGNANTDIVYDEVTGSFQLNVYIPPEPNINRAEGKESRATRHARRDEEWVTVPLEVPARYRNLLLRCLARGQAYAVRVVRKAGRFGCFMSFSLGDAAEVDRSRPMAGIDLNPDVVAVTVALPDGNFKMSRCFWCYDLVHASHNKRKWMAGNVAAEIAAWLESLGIKQVALEELSFAQDHDTNRVFNRITHNFCTMILFNRIAVALRKRGVAVFTVPARFTSLIGYVKYAETYGLSVHQAAALVIARRALGLAEKVPLELRKKLSPKEGWQHTGLWGRLFGLSRAAKRNAALEGQDVRSWTPQHWLAWMLARQADDCLKPAVLPCRGHPGSRQHRAVGAEGRRVGGVTPPPGMGPRTGPGGSGPRDGTTPGCGSAPGGPNRVDVGLPRSGGAGPARRRWR